MKEDTGPYQTESQLIRLCQISSKKKQKPTLAMHPLVTDTLAANSRDFACHAKQLEEELDEIMSNISDTTRKALKVVSSKSSVRGSGK